MKLIDLDNEIDKKHYGPNSLLEDTKKLHDGDGIEMIAVVYKKKDGTVGFGTSRGNNAEFVGLLEVGKVQLIDEMNELE